MGFGTDTMNKDTATIPPEIGDNPGIKSVEPVVLKPADEKLVDQKYVDDTFHNATAVNVDRFPQVVKDLRGFADGKPITVLYFKEHYSETDIKGRHYTVESTNNVHNSVLKIYNFEIRLSGSLEYNHNTEDAFSELTGEAFTYPGFIPEEGDRFIYEISIGRYGLFRVVRPPVRTSIRASTYHKISFALTDYLTEEKMREYEAHVVDCAYFDKQRFLAEPGALLLHDEVVEIEYCKKQRAKMINYFQSKFLDDQIMYSYMRPDGVYDPYVTDFMRKILDFSETGVMVTQLYEGAPFMDESIWSALLDPDIPLESVPTSTAKYLYQLGSKSVLVTSLINKPYLKWIPSQNLKDYLDELMNPGGGSGGETPTGEIPPDPSIPQLTEDEEADKMLGDLLLHIHPHYTECPLIDGNGSEEIGGTGDGLGYILGEGDQFALIAYFLLRREIRDLKRLHDLIERVWKMEKIQQFYLMPVLIHLTSIVVGYIRHSDGLFEPGTPY